MQKLTLTQSAFILSEPPPSLVEPKGVSIISDLSQKKGNTTLPDTQRRQVDKRIELFDKVCDVLKCTPKELVLQKNVGLIARTLVEVSGLPIEKFQPEVVRRRVIEYYRRKAGG